MKKFGSLLWLLRSLFVTGGSEAFQPLLSRVHARQCHNDKRTTISHPVTTTTRLSAEPNKPNDDKESSNVVVHEKDAPTKKEDDKEYDERDLVSWEDMDWETAQKEREQSNKMWFRFWAPYEISRYVTAALWAFVIVGYLLNVMGYAYVWTSDGQLTIDTLAQQEFQQELARGLRETSRNSVPPP
eukprot:scaffold15_cov204-Amphora_coffeaeformis.AAC.5